MHYLQPARDTIIGRIQQLEVELDNLRISLEHMDKIIQAPADGQGAPVETSSPSIAASGRNSVETVAQNDVGSAPARRGRPPKNANKDSTVAAGTNTATASGSVAEKKKPGRPKKNSDASGSVVAAQSTAPEASGKRKPGRPKKNAEAAQPPVGGAPSVGAASQSSGAGAEPEKRKPGRPKKIETQPSMTGVAAASSDGHPGGASAVQGQPEKRKPGRPKKNADQAPGTGKASQKAEGARRGRPPKNDILPDTSEDFWKDLVTAEKKDLSEIFSDAIAKLGGTEMDAPTERKLRNRMEHTIQELVKNNVIFQDTTTSKVYTQ